MKLLLVDSRVQYQQIVDARKDDVDYIVFNYRSDTFKTLLDKIDANKYTEIGLVQHTFVGFDILARETIGDNSDLPPYPSFASLKDFLIGLKTKGVSIFDFLGCDLYDPEKTPAIFEYLEEQTGVDLRASSNLTGNKTSGGDWILESDNVDVKNVYFTDKIDEWKGTLIYFTELFIPNDRVVDINGNVMYFNVDISGFPINPLYDASGYNVKYPNSNLFVIPSSVSGYENSSYSFSNDNSNVVAVIPGGGTTSYEPAGNGYAFAALKVDGSVIVAAYSNTPILENLDIPLNEIIQNAPPETNVKDLLSSNVVSLYASPDNFFALKNDGSIIIWGGDWNAIDYRPGTQTSYVVAACTNSTVYACLRNDGSVFVLYGDDSKDPPTPPPNFYFVKYGYYMPPDVKSKLSSGVVSISPTVYGFYALKSNGTVVYWGQNFTLNSSSFGFRVHSGWENSSNIIAVFSDAHCGLKADGSVDLWIQMVNDINFNFNKPYLQNQLSSGVKMIYTNNDNTLYMSWAALKYDGSVVAWGYRRYGGDLNHPVYGVKLGDVNSGVVAIYPNNYGFAALKKDGSVVYWGVSNAGPADLLLEKSQLSSGVVWVYPIKYSNGFIAVKNDGSSVLFSQHFGWNDLNNSNKKAIRFYNSPFRYSAEYKALSYGVLREDGSIQKWNGYTNNLQYADSSNCAIHLVSNTHTMAALVPSPSVSLSDYYYPTGGINVKSLPNQPILNMVIYTGSSFQLSWSPNYYSNNDSITYYVISDGINDISRNAANGTSYTYIYSDSSNGMVYNFSVAAGNIYGKGLTSNIVQSRKTVYPDPPKTINAVSGNKTANLFWTPPINNGNSPINYYLISNGVLGTSDISVNATINNYIYNDLSNFITYTFSVKAVNMNGYTSYPISVSSIVGTPPSAPKIIYARADDQSVFLYWIPPNDGSVVTYYLISNGVLSDISVNANALSNNYLFTGLTNGITYNFTVKSGNLVGLSNYSLVSRKPNIYINRATLISVTPGNKSVYLTWSPPADNTVRNYIISNGFSDVKVDGSSTNYTWFGLNNSQTYYFAVRYVASSGFASSFSNIIQATPLNVPISPTLISAVSGNKLVNLTWTTDISDGSPPIIYYLISNGDLRTPDISMNAASTNCIYNYLINGVSYNFSIKAVNSIGPSLISNILPAIPSTVPDSPTLNPATLSDGRVMLSWTPAFFNGGSPVTYYLISREGAVDISRNASNGTNYTYNDLSCGTLYKFTIKSGNVNGDSLPSNLREVIPITVPNAPFLNNPVAGNLSISLSWSAPTYDGGSPITQYNIYITDDNSIFYVRSVYAHQRSYLFTDVLSGDTQWFFFIKAVNSAGEGYSSETLSNYGRIVPEPPILDSITLTGNSVVLNWTPSSNGGSELLRYNIIKTPATDPNQQEILTASNTDIDYMCNGLVSGVGYVFRIKAVNIVGESRYSNYLATTIGDVPTPPTLNLPTLENGNVNLSWSIPTSNGGTIIQRYIISNGVSQDVIVNDVNNTSYSYIGLDIGTYTFQVRAVNLSGPSNYSKPIVFTIN